MQGTRHVLFLQVWSFWYLVKLKPVVHPIREDLQSCSMPTCGLTGYGPARSCILELNPAVVSVFHQLVPHWSPISCVLPFVGRLGPACAKIGLGFAVVGWFRRLCPSPPPLVLVRFRRPPLCFSLVLSGFARSGPGVLVLVFSPSLFLLRSPSLCPG